MAVAVKGKPETLSDTVAEPSLEAAAVAPGFAGQRTGSATLSHSPARQIVPFPEWISLRHTQLRPAVQVFPEPTFQSQHGLPGFPLPRESLHCPDYARNHSTSVGPLNLRLSSHFSNHHTRRL